MNNDRLSPLSVRDGHLEYSADGKVLLFMLLYGGDFAANQKRAKELLAAASTVNTVGGVGVKVPVRFADYPSFVLRPLTFAANAFEYMINAAYLAECTHSDLIRTRDRALRAQLAADKSAKLGKWDDIPPALLAGQPGSTRDPDGGPARIGGSNSEDKTPEHSEVPLAGARKIAQDANTSATNPALSSLVERLNASGPSLSGY